MKIPRTQKGFTLIELLVVIGIIALLASIALPAFSGVQLKAAQTKAMNNAKQIGFACKAFSVDNNGQYPTYPETSGSFSTTQATIANDALNDLIPTYLQTIQCFYQPGSVETPLSKAPPDPDLSAATGVGSQSAATALPTKTNHWAYVCGMNETSNSSFPLITDNPNVVASAAVKWTNDQTLIGSVWKGKTTIVVRVDDSANVDPLNAGFQDLNGPGGIDLFNTAGTSGWMKGSATAGNVLLQPN